MFSPYTSRVEAKITLLTFFSFASSNTFIVPNRLLFMIPTGSFFYIKWTSISSEMKDIIQSSLIMNRLQTS